MRYIKDSNDLLFLFGLFWFNTSPMHGDVLGKTKYAIIHLFYFKSYQVWFSSGINMRWPKWKSSSFGGKPQCVQHQLIFKWKIWPINGKGHGGYKKHKYSSSGNNEYLQLISGQSHQEILKYHALEERIGWTWLIKMIPNHISVTCILYCYILLADHLLRDVNCVSLHSAQ